MEMKFIARKKPVIQAEPFQSDLCDGMDILCAMPNTGSCSDSDDGHCFTGTETCRFRMPLPYVTINRQSDISYLTPGCYIEHLPEDGKKVWDKYDFEFMYEPLESSEMPKEPTVTKDELISQILDAAETRTPFLFSGNVLNSKCEKKSWRLQFAGIILVEGDTKTHDGITAFYPMTVFDSPEELERFLTVELE